MGYTQGLAEHKSVVLGARREADAGSLTISVISQQSGYPKEGK
jgi:hypothetical protein